MVYSIDLAGSTDNEIRYTNRQIADKSLNMGFSIEIFIESLLKLLVNSTANGKAAFSWHNFCSISACHIFFRMTQE